MTGVRSFGLRYLDARTGTQVALLHVAAGGWLTLGTGALRLWSHPHRHMRWEAYEAEEGLLCDTREQAEAIAQALKEAAEGQSGSS